MPEQSLHPIGILLQLGPPQLFEQQGAPSGGVGVWIWAIGGLLAALLMAVAARRVWRMRLSDERLAFEVMSRRLGLRRSHREAIERLARRSGTHAIGLIMCESAFARAAAGERFGESGAIEQKPVLLTGAELAELGSACEQIFGPGGAERLQRDEDEPEGHEEDISDADQPRRSQWVA